MKMKLPFSECRYCVYDQDILSGMTRNNDYFVAKLYQCLLVTPTSFVIFDSRFFLQLTCVRHLNSGWFRGFRWIAPPSVKWITRWEIWFRLFIRWPFCRVWSRALSSSLSKYYVRYRTLDCKEKFRRKIFRSVRYTVFEVWCWFCMQTP